MSCQALPDSPLHDPHIIAALARCAERGGAVGVRVDGPEDIAAVRRAVAVPIIGLYKVARDRPVYITPTFEEARAIARAGADLIALQATRERDTDRNADSLPALIARIHAECGIPVMADVSTLDEGRGAATSGADVVATTMAGYTPQSRQLSGPDLELIRELAGALAVPIVAEGRITTPEEAAGARRAGAFAVVVGRAITMPESITARFVSAVDGGEIGAG